MNTPISSPPAATSQFSRGLYRFSWIIVAYTVVIILWGAWVRLSGSGDGCGDHWPLCNGNVVPAENASKTWIEFSHRISTAIFGLLVLTQIVITRKTFESRHPARFWAIMTLLFTVTEALIGRQLVKFGLVNESTDIARLIVMPLHLINTSLLLFVEVMTAESVRFGVHSPRHPSPKERHRGAVYLISLTVVLITGAVAALGSHLAPSQSLLEGLSHDLAPNAHPAVRLRILHPLCALAVPMGLYLFSHFSPLAVSNTSQAVWYKRFSHCVLIAVLIGIATLGFLAPPWLKLTHLFMTNILVVTFSLCVFHTFRPEPTK